MIMFKENYEDVNIIHVIMGRESAMQLNMTGHISIDINEMIEPGKKNVLYINRCGSEIKLSQTLKIAEKIGELTGESNKSSDSHAKKDDKKVFDKYEKIHGSIDHGVKCPSCSNDGARVKGKKISMCDSCRTIEEGIKQIEEKNMIKVAKPKVEDTVTKTPSDVIKNFFTRKNKNKDE